MIDSNRTLPLLRHGSRPWHQTPVSFLPHYCLLPLYFCLHSCTGHHWRGAVPPEKIRNINFWLGDLQNFQVSTHNFLLKWASTYNFENRNFQLHEHPTPSPVNTNFTCKISSFLLDDTNFWLKKVVASNLMKPTSNLKNTVDLRTAGGGACNSQIVLWVILIEAAVGGCFLSPYCGCPAREAIGKRCSRLGACDGGDNDPEASYAVLAKVWSEWWAGGLVVGDKVERKRKVGTSVHGRKNLLFLSSWVGASEIDHHSDRVPIYDARNVWWCMIVPTSGTPLFSGG